MNNRYFAAKGFSLIELTVVLLIITLLASVAVRETSELAFQTRYEQTKERLERIKQAILGNPRQIINGQQAISGFVADMGRLPVNLRELVSDRPFCYATDYGTDLSNDTLYGTQALCEGAGFIWHIPTPANIPNPSAGSLKSGWRGPYLLVNESPTSSTTDIFLDGWANQSNSIAPNEHFYDYGWFLCHWDAADDTLDIPNNLPDDTDAIPDKYPNCNLATIANLDHLTIYSLGKNGTGDVNPDGSVDCGGNGYDGDCYVNLLPEDYKVDIQSGISVNISKQFGTNRFCGFDASGTYTPLAKCENAGGTWSAGVCTLDEDNCKKVGGKWNACFFAPSNCTAAGGAPQTSCQFTEKACNTADVGAWDTINRVCQVHSDQTKCENAGGTWNGTTSRCDFNESSCSLAGGSWTADCQFTDSSCPTTTGGVIWETTKKPDSCNFTNTACTTLNGISLGDGFCYLSHGENHGVKYEQTSCDGAGGAWTGQICLIIFYRDPITSTIVSAASDPVVINGSGGYQTIQFTGLKNGGAPVNQIPFGQNAIGIYEYDGNCEPSNPLYPADRQNPIQVEFRAHTTLPVINW